MYSCTIIGNSSGARAVPQEYLGRRNHCWRLTGFRTLSNLGPTKDSRLSKPIACMLGGGKAPRLSEVHCDQDSVCV